MIDFKKRTTQKQAILDLAEKKGFVNPKIEWDVQGKGKINWFWLLKSDSHKPVDLGHTLLNAADYAVLLSRSAAK